jgi:alpha/beta superfamily hydrolase
VSRYKLRVDGPDGKIEVVINDPGHARRGIALVAHPHPLHGGSMDNKVVQTVADTLFELGYVAVRPNFRGVGQSEGSYDNGNGEVEDMLATANFVLSKYPDLPLVLAGFSFGAYVQCQVCSALSPQRVILIGPAVNLFEFGAPPAGAVVIHGEKDELVPLEAVQTWTAALGVEVVIVTDADHFFHRKLPELKRTIIEKCQL